MDCPRAVGLSWPAVRGPSLALPALQRAHVNAGNLSGRPQPRSGGVGRVAVLGLSQAVFEDDSSSLPLLKIASTFQAVGLEDP